MKAGWMKRVMAIGLCLTILAGVNVKSVIAAAQEDETVSGNDVEYTAGNEEEEQPSQDIDTEAEESETENAEDIIDVQVPDVSGDDAANDVSGNDVSGNDVSGNDIQDMVILQTEVDGVTITLSARAEDIPEGAELWAEEIRQDRTNKEQISVIDEALAAEAEEKQFEVQQYKAFDIKLLVDGETVQPTGDVVVKFEGDILLPKQEESLAVYHITEDAVADQVGGLNEENLPEMVTDHFSTYVIVVAEGVTGECSVNIHHFLQVETGKEEEFRSRYTDANGNSRYEFRQEEGGSLYYEGYRSETESINAFQEMTIPVQKNGSYNLVKIEVKDKDGNVVYTSEDVNGTEDKVQVTIEKDSEVELYYDYTVNNNFRDDVTYFDYSILGGYSELKSVREEDMKNRWEITFSTTKDGKTESYKYQGNGVFKNKNTGAEYTVGLNDVLYNFNDTTWLYEKITVLDMSNGMFSFWYEDSAADSDRGNGTGLGLRNTGINSPKYAYDENGVYHGNTGYFAIGTYGDVHFHDYYIPVNKVIDGVNVTLNANTNNSNHWAHPDYPYVDPVTGTSYGTTVLKGTDAIVPGLVQGLSGDRYETLVMAKGIYEPGYFTSEDLVSVVNGVEYYDKKVYSNEFELKFERSGYKYQLLSSVDVRTGEETLAGLKNEGNFFPLNGVDYKDTAAQVEALEGPWGERYNAFTKSGANPEGNNCFFGMRYDFSFSLGDYVGPLEYSFIGDDDLWVFVDGHLVLDLGGMHSAYPTAYVEGGSYNGFEVIDEGREANSVDIWSAVYRDADGNTHPVIDPDDTERTHQVTVLYMERGGYDSNCYMEFILPNVAPMQSVITNRPVGKFTFEKTDEMGNGLAGAEFELRSANNVIAGSAVSDEAGVVRFTGLAAGTYTLKEVKAPEGYELSETEYTVWVREDGKNITVETNIPDNRVINHKLVQVLVEKVWQDADGRLIAPGAEEIQVRLYRNGMPIQGKPVTLNKENDWSFTYEGLAWCDETGKPYTYEVKEEKVPEGYEVSYEQDEETGKITIVNTRTTGSLVITKTVDKVNLAYGAPAFTFKISGPEGQVLYRTITFENEQELTKSITVTGIPAGTYTVEELETLRYRQVSVNAATQEVTGTDIPHFEFKNAFTSDKYYSHSDVIVNSFRMDEDGNVVVSQARKVTEEE